METGLAGQLDAHLHQALRRAVFDHAVNEPRARFPARLHLGTPGGAVVVQAVTGEAADHALRVDLVAAMLTRLGDDDAPDVLVWLTRPGDLEPVQDADQEWLAAAVQAFAELGRELVFVTVTRRGWRDPRSGASRRWVRMRRRSAPPRA